jgi:hypothetical protein
MNPLHLGISSLAAQISFQASRMREPQSAQPVRSCSAHRQRAPMRACADEPGILSRAIAQVAEVATLTRRH